MKENTVRITLGGGAVVRLMSELAGEQIAVFSPEKAKISREFEFSVRKKDLSKTFAILDRMCYNYKVHKLSRFGAAAMHLVKRSAFLVGALVIAVFFALSRRYVWSVKVSGNYSVPTKAIENALREQNIAVGCKVADFDAVRAEKALYAIDGINLATVYAKGTSVYVEVFESESLAAPVEYFDTDIVSEYDATVTAIVAREGTPLVEIGSHVYRGTPLIGAHRTDINGEEVACKSSGKIYGIVSFTESAVITTEWYERTETESETYTRVSLFGLTFGKAPDTGADCEAVTRTAKLDCFLPISVTHTEVRRTQMRKMTASIDELAEKYEREVKSRFIHEHISSGMEVSRSVRALGNNAYSVSVYVSAETVIGGA